MSRNHLLKTGKTVAAVLLCLSGALIPCVSSSVISLASEKNTVEVTMRLCGIPGYRPSTVSLTRLQYAQVTASLDTLLERLNATTSQEGMLVVLHEAIAELAAYGVLPRGVSVSHLQMLLSRCLEQSRMFSQRGNAAISKWFNTQQGAAAPTTMNAVCALFAVATKIPGYENPVIIPFGLLLMLGLFPALIVSIFGQDELANQLAELGLSLWMANPLRWFNYVVFEGYTIEFRSVGLKGLVHETLEGSGGFTGYTGLMVSFSEEQTFFLGFAFRIYRPN